MKIRSKKVLVHPGTRCLTKESADGRVMETEVLGEPKVSFISHDHASIQIVLQIGVKFYSFVAKMKGGHTIGSVLSTLPDIFRDNLFEEVETSVVTVIPV